MDILKETKCACSNIRELHKQIGNCHLVLECLNKEKELGDNGVHAMISGDLMGRLTLDGCDDNFEVVITFNDILKEAIEKQLKIYKDIEARYLKEKGLCNDTA